MNHNAKGRFVVGNKPANSYTDERMISLVLEYCEHRSYGKSKESFRPCSHKTIEKWMDKNGTAFPALRARAIDAEAKGHYLWESLLFNVAFGLTTTIRYPTDNNPYNTYTIDPKYAKPNLLMFLARAKYPYTYGRLKRKRDVEYTSSFQSQPFAVLDSDGKPSELL